MRKIALIILNLAIPAENGYLKALTGVILLFVLL